MAKKVLFISSELALYQMGTIFLNFGDNDCICHFACSITQASEKLGSNHYDLIFMGHKITLDADVCNLNEALKENIMKCDPLVFGTNKSLLNQDFARYYSALIPITKIILDIFKELGFKHSESVDYIPFPVEGLKGFTEFPFDCFLKIKKGDKYNYLHLFRLRELIENEDIDKLLSKGAKEIYASFDQMKKRVAELEKVLKKDLSTDLMSNPEEAHVMAAQYSFDILKESGLDISQEVFKRNEDAYLSTKELIKISPGKNEFKKLLNTGGEFYYKHVSMTSLMCCYILDELSIKDRSYRYKLCNAAYFQNIYLNEDIELKIDNHGELLNFNEEDQKRISHHALMAFELLSKNPLIDSDVLRIVREQHGDKRGVGFPNVMTSTNKISLIFQLATTFSLHYLIQYEDFGQVDAQVIFNQISKKLESKDRLILESFYKVATGEEFS